MTSPDSTDTDRLAETKARLDLFREVGGTEPLIPEGVEFLLSLVEQLRTENAALRAAPEIIASPEKAKRIASLVASSTRLVQIERDDARAQVDRLQAELGEQRYYGEQLQMSLDSCSGSHLAIAPYEHEEADAQQGPTTALDSPMDEFEAADDIDRRWE